VDEASIVSSEAITVSFGGFTPFEYVQLIVASTPKVIGSGYANAQGVVTITGTLPNSLSSGSHTLAVYAPKSGIGFSQTITVSQAKLPATGFNVFSLLVLLATLLLVGYLSLLYARRRSAI
jgi:LPXTG-motif cell wall-anchored protein